MEQGVQPTILLVDDDENDYLLILRALQKAGVDNPLEWIRNGEETENYLSGKGEYADRNRYPIPIIVLLDLKMPRMNGFEVLRWVRSHPVLKMLWIVVLTSSVQPEDIRMAHELGANSYLVKPSDFSTLVRLIQRLNDFWLRTAVPPDFPGSPDSGKVS